MTSQPKLNRKEKESVGAGPSQDGGKKVLSGGKTAGGLTRIRTGSLERLPSLRPKRDLTLGGVPKKTFTPTIPTVRRTKKEPSSSQGVADSANGDSESSQRGRRRPSLEKKGGREPKKRTKKEVVTAPSVFSMGPADKPMEGRTGFIPGTFGAELAKRPSFSSKDKDGGSDKRDHRFSNSFAMGNRETEEEEAESMRGGTVEELFGNSLVPPVQLPLDYSMHAKQTTLPSVKTAKRIKQELRDDSVVEDMDTSESGQSTVKPARISKPTGVAEVKGHQITAAQLFTSSENTMGKFLFIQLPDCLPIPMATADKGTHQPMEVEKSSRASSVLTTASAVTSEGEPEQQRHCGLVDVPEGFIGKLRVHKSGKVKLTLGEVTMDVAMGTSCGFLQQLVSVRCGPPQPKMAVLGQLSHRLVCSPDFETMLEKVAREPHIES